MLDLSDQHSDYVAANTALKPNLIPKHALRLVIENTYKSPVNTPDTVSIVTSRDGADCGYAFKIGKEYIVYATNWEPKGTIKKATEASSPGMFYTSICTLTKETNRKELVKLNRLVC